MMGGGTDRSVYKIDMCVFRTSDSSSSGHASSSPAFVAVLASLLLARSSITVTTRRCLCEQGS